jgi:hypothetical protein
MAWTAYDLIPPLFGLAGGALGGFYSARAAVKSWERARHDMAAKQAVELIQAAITELAGLSHSAMWLTWKATYDPGNLGREDFARYDAQSLERMPRLLGSIAALSSIDAVTAAHMLPFASDISMLDGRIGSAAVRAMNKDVAELAALYEPSVAAFQSLFTAMANLTAGVIGRKENVVLK